MSRTKAEIAQEILDFNLRHRGTGRFSYSRDPEVMAIYEDLAWEHGERERQRRWRIHHWRLMSIATSCGDKSFGMQEIVER